MAATYKDIQRITGLSLSTISKYYNGGSLKDKNVQLIEDAIQKLDYHVNDLARGLKSKRSRSIGILIPELTSPFHTAIMSEVSDYLRRHGYSGIVCDCHEDKVREVEALQFLLDKMVDGIITIPLDGTGRHLALTRKRGTPVVLVDRFTTNFKADAIIIDNEHAGKMAAAELLRNGHRNIALLNGPPNIYTMHHRKEGFAKELEDIGWDAQKNTYNTEFSVAGGYETGKRILQSPNPVTAVFCTNYEITLGFIIALNELNLRIGDDVSLIGFDNLMLSNVIKPAVTMIVQPIEEIARKTVDMMLSLFEDANKSPETIVLQPQLIRGGSVRKLQ